MKGCSSNSAVSHRYSISTREIQLCPFTVGRPDSTHDVRVLDQTLGDEILELVTEVAFQLGRFHRGDQEQELHRVLRSVRRFPSDELDGGDTERPEVSLVAISSLQNHFRGLEGRGDQCN
jgi:hypothetical protein